MKREGLRQNTGAEALGATPWCSKKGKQDNGLYQQREQTQIKRRDLVTVRPDIVALQRAGGR